MNWQENKLEWSLAIGIGLVVGSLFFGFRSMQQRNFTPDEIAYEMGRPDSFIPSEYDLSGRRIERRVLNPFERIVEAIKGLVKKDTKTAAVKKDEKKKTDQVVKKDDKSKMTAQKKRPQFQTRVVGRDSDRKSRDSIANNSYRNTQALGAVAANAVPEITKTEEKKDTVAKASEYKSLLHQNPNYENMKKLIAAVAASEVSQNDFYSIVQMLLDETDSTSNNVGLFGLQSYPRAESFIILAQNYDASSPKFNARTQAYAKQIMMGYSQPQRISILGQVLSSNDLEVVKAAGTVISEALQNIDSGNVSYISSGRGGDTRGNAYSQQDASAYTNLVPVIEAANDKISEQEIKELLITLIEQINNLKGNSTT